MLRNENIKYGSEDSEQLSQRLFFHILRAYLKMREHTQKESCMNALYYISKA